MCTVTSEAGVTRQYWVDVMRAPSNIATLASLTPSSGTLSPNFYSTGYSYTLSVPNSVTTMSFTSTETDNTATTVWSPNPPTNVPLPVLPTVTTFTATVTAQDGTTVKKYTVQVSRARSSNAYLSVFSVVPVGSSASQYPPFGSTVYAYDLSAKLGRGVSQVKLTATPQDATAVLKYRWNSGTWTSMADGATVTISITQGNNQVQVLSTAQDGTTTRTYSVNFYKVSNDAALASLGVSTGSLSPVFSPSTASYTLRVPATTSSVTVTAASRSSAASSTFSYGSAESASIINNVAFTLDLPDSGDSTLTIVTVSEDMSATHTVTVTIQRLSDEVALRSLSSPQGAFTQQFTSDLTDVQLILPNTATSLQLIAAPTYPQATLSYSTNNGLSFTSMTAGSTTTALPTLLVGDSSVIVRVTSQSGSLYADTSVHVHRMSAAVTLQSLAVNGASVSLTSGVWTYSVAIPASTTQANVQPTASSSFATLTCTVDGGEAMTVDSGAFLPSIPIASGKMTTVTVSVRAEDGSGVGGYILNIHRLSSETRLSALALKDSSNAAVQLTPAFSADITGYAATLTSQQASITVNIKAMADAASVEYVAGSSATVPSSGFTAFTSSVSSALSMPVGDRYIFVRVTSEDGISVRVYTIHVHRVSAVASLSVADWTVTSDGSALTQSPSSFSAGTLAYTVTIPSSVSTVSLTATVTYPLSQVHYTVNDGDRVTASVNAASGSVTLPSVGVEIGVTSYVLTVTSEDGSAQRVYTFSLHRVSSDASLRFLGTGVSELNPPFTPATSTYSANLPSNIDAIQLMVVKAYDKANMQYSTDGGSTYNTLTADSLPLSLSYGDNAVSLRVTAEDGSISHTYALTIHRLSSDASITAVTMSVTPVDSSPSVWSTNARQSSFKFSASVSSIDVSLTLGYALTTATYSLQTSGQNAWQSLTVGAGTATGTITALPLTLGTNTLLIQVMSEDARTIVTYTMTLHRLSNDAKLAALYPNVAALTPAFTPIVTTYSLTMPSGRSQFGVTAVPSSSLASMAIGLSTDPSSAPTDLSPLSASVLSAQSSIPIGMSRIDVRVEAEDGSQQTYTILIHRMSQDATMQTLTVDHGTLTPAFVPNTDPATLVTYSLTLDSTVTSLAVSFSARAGNDVALRSYALISGTTATSVSQQLSSGTLQLDYTILDAETYGMTVTSVSLPYGATTLACRVESEDGTAATVTLINVWKQSNDAKLKALMFDPELPSFTFNPLTTSYSVRVPPTMHSMRVRAVPSHTLTRSLTLTYTGATSSASIEEGLSSGSDSSLYALSLAANTFTIRVVSEDGTMQQDYTVHVYKEDDRVRLSALSVTPSSALPAFNFSSDVLQYHELTVASSSVDSLVVTATPVSGVATLQLSSMLEGASEDGVPISLPHNTPSSPILLASGSTTVIRIEVLAEDGVSVATYALSVRRPSTDCTLSGLSLTPTGFGFTPAFTSTQHTYTARLRYADSVISIAALPSHTLAQAVLMVYEQGDSAGWSSVAELMSGVYTAPLPVAVGPSQLAINVSAEDPTFTCFYTVNIFRLSNEARLQQLKLMPINAKGMDVTAVNLNQALTPAFDMNTHEYTLTVNNDVTDVTATLTPANIQAALSVTRLTTAMQLAGESASVTSLTASVSSPSIRLAVGLTVLTFQVESGDQSSTQTYTVSVTRASHLRAIHVFEWPRGQEHVTTPVYTAGHMTLAVTLPYAAQSACVTADFDDVTDGSDGWRLVGSGLRSGIERSLLPLTASCDSESVTLPLLAATENRYTLSDPRDLDPDHVDLTVTREAATMSALTVVGMKRSLFAPLTPLFDPAMRTYSARAVYVTDAVTVTVRYTHGTCTVKVDTDAELGAQSLVGDGSQSVTVPLRVGVNVLTVTHSTDGSYTLTVTRDAPDVTALSLIGVLADGTASPALVTAPTFTGGHMTYTVTVPSVTTQLKLDCTFVTPSSVSYTWSHAASGTQSSFATQLSSGVVTDPPIDLQLGTTRIILDSARDGSYILDVTRSDADMVGVTVQALHWNAQSEDIPVDVSDKVSPSFTPGQLVTRSVTLPKSVTRVTVTATYLTADSIVQLERSGSSDSGFVSLQRLGSGVPSFPVPLPVGDVTLTVFSYRDGRYPLVITREATDMRTVTMNVAQQGQSDVSSVTLTPPTWSPDQSTYTATLPYRARVITLSAEFATYQSVTLQSASDSASVTTLTSGESSHEWSLSVGSQSFLLSSALDGQYNYTVTRESPDIKSVTLALRSVTDATWQQSPSSFDSSVYAYSGVAHYAASSIDVTAAFDTYASVSVVIIRDGVESAPVVLTSGTVRNFKLPVGTVTMRLTSSADGVYEWTFARLSMDVQGLSMSAYTFSGESVFTPSMPDSLQPSFTDGLSAAMTLARETDTADSSDATALTYSLTVGINVAAVRLTVTAQSAGVASLLSVSYDDGTTDGSGTSTPTVVSLQSGVSSTLLPLSYGLNVLTVHSAYDGSFSLRVTRQAATIRQMLAEGEPIGETQTKPFDLQPLFTAQGTSTSASASGSSTSPYVVHVPFGIDSVSLSLGHSFADANLRLLRSDGGMLIGEQRAASTDVATVEGADARDKGYAFITTFHILSLPIMPNTLKATILSAYDDAIYVELHRDYPDFTDMEFQVETLNTGAVSSRPSSQVLTANEWLQPAAFDAFTRRYALILPYTMRTLSINTRVRTPNSLTLVHSVTGDVTAESLINNTWSTPLTLPVGTITLKLTSTRDGSYNLTVTRQESDLTALAIESATSQCVTDGAVNCAQSVTFQPAFTAASVSGVMSYTVTVPWQMTAVRFLPTFPLTDGSAESSLLLLTDSNTDAESSASPRPVTLPTWTDWLPLSQPSSVLAMTDASVTVTQFLLSSVTDGVYTIDVRRSLPDLQAVRCWVQSVTCAESSADTWMGQDVWAGPVPSQEVTDRQSLLPVTEPTSTQPTLVRFMPAVMSANVTVPYAVTDLSFIAAFGQQWSGSSVTLKLSVVSAAAAQSFIDAASVTQSDIDSESVTLSAPLRSSQVLPSLPLHVGMNRLRLLSETDGVYELLIVRERPTIGSVTLHAAASDDSGMGRVFPLNPAFLPSDFSHESSLPYATNTLTFTLDTHVDGSSKHNGDVIRIRDMDATQGSQAYTGVSLTVASSSNDDGSVTSTSPSYAIPSSSRLRTFRLLSSHSGCYDFSIHHSPPAAIDRLTLRVREEYGSEMEAAAMALMTRLNSESGLLSEDASALLSDTIGMVASNESVTQALNSGTVTSVDASNGYIIRPHALTPPFVSGWLGPYSLHVSHDVTDIRLNLAVNMMNASAVTDTSVTCQINGAPVRMSASVSSSSCGYSQGSTATLSDDCASLASLAVGRNVLTCSTADGLYVINIDRSASSLDLDYNLALNFPHSIYAHETIDSLSVTLVSQGEELMTGDAQLTIQAVTSLGTMTPAVWSVTDGSNGPGPIPTSRATVSYSLTASTTVSAPTPLYVTLLPVGATSWPLLPPVILSTVILPQSAIEVSAWPQFGVWFSRESADPLQVKLTDQVNRGKDVTVTVEMVGEDSGAVIATLATLTFTYENSHMAQPVPVTAPTTSVTLPVLIRFSLSGSDSAHYICPDSRSVTILPQSTFTLTGLPSRMPQSKAATLTMKPTTAPNETVTVTVTLEGSSDVTGGLVMGDKKADAESEAVTDETVTPVILPGSTTLQLVFPAYTDTSVTFTYIAPLSVTSPTSVRLHFSAVGDADRFLPLPSYSVTVMPAIPLTWRNVPVTMMNRQQSGSVTVTVADIDLGIDGYVPTTVSGLTLTLRSQNPHIRFTPSLLTVGADVVNPSVSFTITAPYWYNSASVTFDVTASVSGADSAMFLAPTPASVTLEQQPATVTRVTVYGMGSDGRAMLLSSLMDPFVGNKMKYIVDLAVAIMDPNFKPINDDSTQKTQSQTHTASGTLSHQVTQLFSTLDTTTTTGTTGGVEEGTTSQDPTVSASSSAANFSIAFLAEYSSGDMQLHVSSDDDTSDSNTATYALPSGSLSSWVRLSPGHQTFILSSPLDGNYTYLMNEIPVTDPNECMGAANSSVYGLPTESYIHPPTRLSASVMGSATVGATTPPLLLCVTVANIADAAKLLIDQHANQPVTIQFGLSESSSTSWLFLLGALGYGVMALAAGRLLGADKAQEEEAEHVRGQLKEATHMMAEEEASIRRKAGKKGMDMEKNDGKDESSNSNELSVSSSLSGHGGHVPSVSLSTYASTQLLSLLPASLLTMPRLRLSFPMLLLTLCGLRLVSMLTYYYFFSVVSVELLRLLTGLPHILSLWILTALMIRLPAVMTAASRGRQAATMISNHMALPQWARARPQRMMLVLGVATMMMLSAYVYMLAASPDAQQQNLIDGVMLILLSLAEVACCIHIALHGIQLARQSAPVKAMPAATNMAQAAQRYGVKGFAVESSVGSASGSAAMSNIEMSTVTTTKNSNSRSGSAAWAHTEKEDAQSGMVGRLFLRLTSALRTDAASHESVMAAVNSRRYSRLLFPSLLCLTVSAFILLLSVAWSDLYQSEYLAYVLAFTAMEVSAMACMVLAASHAVATQREQLAMVSEATNIAAEPYANGGSNSKIVTSEHTTTGRSSSLMTKSINKWRSKRSGTMTASSSDSGSNSGSKHNMVSKLSLPGAPTTSSSAEHAGEVDGDEVEIERSGSGSGAPPSLINPSAPLVMRLGRGTHSCMSTSSSPSSAASRARASQKYGPTSPSLKASASLPRSSSLSASVSGSPQPGSAPRPSVSASISPSSPFQLDSHRSQSDGGMGMENCEAASMSPLMMANASSGRKTVTEDGLSASADASKSADHASLLLPTTGALPPLVSSIRSPASLQMRRFRSAATATATGTAAGSRTVNRLSLPVRSMQLNLQTAADSMSTHTPTTATSASAAGNGTGMRALGLASLIREESKEHDDNDNASGSEMSDNEHEHENDSAHDHEFSMSCSRDSDNEDESRMSDSMSLPGQC